MIFSVSQSQEIKIVQRKYAKNNNKTLDFYIFWLNNFDFLMLRDRKNHFYSEILLETCSETSNYLWDTIS